MNVVCDKCGWRVTPGMFVEVNITPGLLSALPADWIAGYLEAEHFLETGCRGSLVSVCRGLEHPAWRYLPMTDQFQRREDGFRITREHVKYWGWPQS